MLIPYHENFNLRSTTGNWNSSDSESTWVTHQNNPRTAKKLAYLGWSGANDITYSINSHGFRDVEFDNRQCGIALGCSFTFGVGIKQEHTWPAQLSQMTGTYVWNLGVGGASFDTAFRLGKYYIGKLAPKFVCLLIPPMSRFEHCVDTNKYTVTNVHDFVDTDKQGFFKEWFGNSENIESHQEKNLLAIKQMCSEYSIPIVHFCPLDDWVPKNQDARDLLHPNQESNTVIASMFSSKLHS